MYPVYVVRYRGIKREWVFPGWDFVIKSQAIEFAKAKAKAKGGEWAVMKAQWKKGKEVLTQIQF